MKLPKQRKSKLKIPYPNVSTTPFQQCLPFSWTTLRGKHCRHPIAPTGVVDTFGPGSLCLTEKKSWLHPWEEKNRRERITKGHKTIQVFLLKCHNICPLEHMTNHYKFLGKQDSYRQEAQTLMYLAWAAEPSSVCQLFLQSKCSDWEDVIFAQFLRSK